ncbi:glucokinase [Stutzerimonas xanthomarina]|uniref:Glucokinase n=2 Tax=Stutzerimonas xanthomarina TaxID=271420 RepID=A0A1M5NTG9_9GAMM|nr:glucokinase [Stutzerimonas xanthomarina]MCP9338756.1 glucokinase [Stutzerimonas xanthomarina]SEH80744.1 glucokinase [Stutzerimonas xanthomarina]SHG92800.1 glucokinase [Stutzerimonas xanthomarina DSM 18231]
MTALVGDIGGTNARFALWRNQQIESVRVLPTVDYPRPEDAIRAYLQGVGQSVEALQAVCLACAGPVSGDEFAFTNNHWRLSRKAFCEELGLSDLLLVNDFTAMALGMTRLREGELIEVCPGRSEPGAARLVIGPGTGLGVATLLPVPGGWKALPGEGGHVCLPIGTAREAALWARLHDKFGHVNAEAILSGGGLLELYRTSCALDGEQPKLTTPAEVTAAALSGDAYAASVLEQFCVWLGRIAGDNVLTTGSRGGVYIAGGIVPRFVEFFMRSGFSQSLRDKGCMSRYFDEIPVWVVTAEYPGLEGAGVALQHLLEGPPSGG